MPWNLSSCWLLCVLPNRRGTGVSVRITEGFPKHGSKLQGAVLLPLSCCQRTSGSPLSFSPPLFRHLPFSCSLRCVPLRSCSTFLTLRALPGVCKWGTKSGCWVAALWQRETFIKQNGAGLGPPAARYAPANLSWAVAPTRLRGLFDVSITEREKPYGERGFVCPLCTPRN